MLEVLKSKKDLYRKVHPSMFGDGCFASKHRSEYDAVIVSGGLGEGHMPVGAIGDSVELLRPGGLFVCVVSVQQGELCQKKSFSIPTPRFLKIKNCPSHTFFPDGRRAGEPPFPGCDAWGGGAGEVEGGGGGGEDGTVQGGTKRDRTGVQEVMTQHTQCKNDVTIST